MNTYTLTLDLPPKTYDSLQRWAKKTGVTPEALLRDILEQALQQTSPASPPDTRNILEAAGVLHPLSSALQKRIIPGVSLEEVRQSLDRAGGPPLSEIIRTQRERTVG